ncbi:MAG: hypothetical protein ACFHX7_00140 [Pseudomonadota bacterium]
MGMTIDTVTTNSSPQALVAFYDDFRHMLKAAGSVESLLDTLYFETQSWLCSDGMQFVGSNMRHVVGVTAVHQCNYSLFFNQDFLGELTFYRGNPFEADELELIEAILGVAIDPLREVLR